MSCCRRPPHELTITRLVTNLQAAAEAKRKLEEEQEKLNPTRVKKKLAGTADWEGPEDQYDATNDMGGEFDLHEAMKDGRRNTKRTDLRRSLTYRMQQKGKQIEADVFGDEERPQIIKKLSTWKSFIYGFAHRNSKGQEADGTQAKELKRTNKLQQLNPNSSNTPVALRKIQKAEALEASKFMGKKGRLQK